MSKNFRFWLVLGWAIWWLVWPVRPVLAYQPDPATYLLDSLPFPRLANYFQKNGMNFEEADLLARRSLLILGVGALESACPECFARMRRQNPNLLTFAYVPMQEIHPEPCGNAPSGAIHLHLCVVAHRCNWVLAPRGCWGGTMDCVDTTDRCPVCGTAGDGQGLRWNEYLPLAVNQFILSQDYWNGGIYFDNAGTGSWDGLTPYDTKITRLTRNHTQPRNKYIAVNSTFDNHNPHAQQVNVALSEDFPEAPIQLGIGNWVWNWAYSIRAYFHWMNEAQPPRSFIAYTRGDWYHGQQCLPPYTNCQFDPRGLGKGRYGLGTILLHNGFFDYQRMGRDGIGPWLDEYGVNLATGEASGAKEHLGYLGFPLNDAYDVASGKKLGEVIETNFGDLENRVWRRDFDHGLVLVNPSSQARNVTGLGQGVYKRIKGSLSTGVNNGQLVQNEAVLGPTEALVLIKSGLAPTPTPRPVDLNNDGKINETDLSLLLAGWATQFGVADLNSLLSNWQP